MNDGKSLELLIAAVESLQLPKDFEIVTNKTAYDEYGNLVAEFDVHIKGKLGTTTISWLLECRDRPSSGVAPAAWIEQLAGRKSRFNFNQVTAVSTTGFSPGAKSFAKQAGIELREVRALDADAFKEWFSIDDLYINELVTSLKHVHFHAFGILPPQVRTEIDKLLETPEKIVLKSSVNSRTTNIIDEFEAHHTQLQKEIVEKIQTKAHGDKPIILAQTANYDINDCFIIETESGSAKIKSIRFEATIQIEEKHAPILSRSEYTHSETGELISQNINYETQFTKTGNAYRTHLIKFPFSENYTFVISKEPKI